VAYLLSVFVLHLCTFSRLVSYFIQYLPSFMYIQRTPLCLFRRLIHSYFVDTGGVELSTLDLLLVLRVLRLIKIFVSIQR